MTQETKKLRSLNADVIFCEFCGDRYRDDTALCKHQDCPINRRGAAGEKGHSEVIKELRDQLWMVREDLAHIVGDIDKILNPILTSDGEKEVKK